MSKTTQHKKKAEEIEVPAKVQKAHDEAMKRFEIRKQTRQSKERDFFSKNYEFDVKQTYINSLPLAEAAEDKKTAMAHLESVIVAGAGKFKK